MWSNSSNSAGPAEIAHGGDVGVQDVPAYARALDRHELRSLCQPTSRHFHANHARTTFALKLIDDAIAIMRKALLHDDLSAFELLPGKLIARRTLLGSPYH